MYTIQKALRDHVFDGMFSLAHMHAGLQGEPAKVEDLIEVLVTCLAEYGRKQRLSQGMPELKYLATDETFLWGFSWMVEKPGRWNDLFGMCFFDPELIDEFYAAAFDLACELDEALSTKKVSNDLLQKLVRLHTGMREYEAFRFDRYRRCFSAA